MATTVHHETSEVTVAPTSHRTLAIRADLLPGEVTTARAIDATRKRVLIAVAAVVALLVALYAFSWWQTGSANDDLERAQGQAQTLQAKQNSYRPLVTAISDTSAIQEQLRALMTSDLSWRALLASVTSAAPSGVRITSVSGSVSAPGSTATTPTAGLDPSAVGTLTLQGVAPSKNAVAAYLDRLTTTKGVANPLLGSASTVANGVSFSVTVNITSAALGGRYTTRGGK